MLAKLLSGFGIEIDDNSAIVARSAQDIVFFRLDGHSRQRFAGIDVDDGNAVLHIFVRARFGLVGVDVDALANVVIVAVAVDGKGGHVGHVQETVAVQIRLWVVVEFERRADGVDTIGQRRQFGHHVVGIERHIALHRHGTARNELKHALFQTAIARHVVGNTVHLDGE